MDFVKRPCHLFSDLRRDLDELELKPGVVLVTHCSLRSIGMIIGGVRTYVEALTDALGKDGTLVMPAHCGELSDPAQWNFPPVPKELHEQIRSSMPTFDLEKTPTWNIGLAAEYFRTYPGVSRSPHPKDSFCALGKHQRAITDQHPLDYGLSDTSPLGRIYELDGWVLLAGVGLESNTSLHLSEYRANYHGKREFTDGSPLLIKGERKWVEYRDVETNSDVFGVVMRGVDEGKIECSRGRFGNADSLLMRQRDCVDYFTELLERGEVPEFSKAD